jgi:uncharacterized protein CbrC (UPF0167 family)
MSSTPLPAFRYHPDPIASGSVIASDATCACCDQPRAFVYDGPVYSEEELDGVLCPWCVADGSAHEKFDATFVDSEAIADGMSDAARDEIEFRTPGFSTWQSEHWPACCDDAAAFIGPVGIAEIRARFRELEGAALSHIIYKMGISGGAATRLLQSLDREKGPTAYVFKCLKCETAHFHIDRP